jgi:hypothetical protein
MIFALNYPTKPPNLEGMSRNDAKKTMGYTVTPKIYCLSMGK